MTLIKVVQSAPHQSLDGGRLDHWCQRFTSGAAMDVPCGTCNLCCRSALFIHIGADETEALQHIPKALRAPAPGDSEGTQVMGFNAQGHCPMLGPEGCTIYAHRPRTCRRFDCRSFAAVGFGPGAKAQQPLTAYAGRWQFQDPGQAAPRLHQIANWLAHHPQGPTDSATLVDLTMRIDQACDAPDPSEDHLEAHWQALARELNPAPES